MDRVRDRQELSYLEVLSLCLWGDPEPDLSFNLGQWRSVIDLLSEYSRSCGGRGMLYLLFLIAEVGLPWLLLPVFRIEGSSYLSQRIGDIWQPIRGVTAT